VERPIEEIDTMIKDPEVQYSKDCLEEKEAEEEK
jgi:hypothetical protein